MSVVTLEAVQAKQSELEKMIQQLTAQSTLSVIKIADCTIELAAGEHYAGVVLDEAGNVKHHLVLMAERPENSLNWQDAMDWAEGIGGAIPDRQECSLLFANCKPHLKAEWHWSCETYKDNASCAWDCTFGFGYISNFHKYYEFSAVAVRRL